MKYLKELKIKLVKSHYKNPVKGQVRGPEQVYKVFRSIKDYAKETLIGVYLDNDMEVRAYDVLSIGTENEALFSAIEVLEHAIILKSRYFILLHNHPSGDPTPSDYDRKSMMELMKKSQAMDRVFLDFIIVGDVNENSMKKNYWSMFEEAEGGEYTLGGII